MKILITNAATGSLASSFGEGLRDAGRVGFLSAVLTSVSNFLLLTTSTIRNNKFTGKFLKAGKLLATFLTTFVAIGVCGVAIGGGIAVQVPRRIPPGVSRIFGSVVPFALIVIILCNLSVIAEGVVKAGITRSVVGLFRPLFATTSNCLNVAVVFNTCTLF